MNGFKHNDKKLLKLIQNDFPLNKRPWKSVGEKLNLEEDEVLSRIKRLYDRGIIRKISPVLNGRKAGFTSSTLVALRVKEEEVQKVARIINEYHNVTHNYQREHEFNIWFTITALNDEELSETLQNIKRIAEIEDDDMLDLPTIRLFKIDTRFILR